MQCMPRSINLCRQVIRIRQAYESFCYIPKNPFVFSASHVQLNSIVFQFINFDILIDHCRHYLAKEIYTTVCTGQRNLQKCQLAATDRPRDFFLNKLLQVVNCFLNSLKMMALVNWLFSLYFEFFILLCGFLLQNRESVDPSTMGTNRNTEILPTLVIHYSRIFKQNYLVIKP